MATKSKEKHEHARQSHPQREVLGTEFRLFAPRPQKVALQGSWNDFKSVPMERGEDGAWYALVDLSDGEHQYRFEIDWGSGSYVVADPVGIRYSDESNEMSVIVIADSKPVYHGHAWGDEDTMLPPNHQLIIYEMHVGNFRGGDGDDSDAPGTFTRVVEKLDYLADLGITAVELMPVTTRGYGDVWGYSQLSLYSVQNDYGTPGELAHLVDECHKRGIRVIYDAVLNHLHPDGTLARIDNGYWFYEEDPSPPELQFGPKFNYEMYDETLGIFPAREHALGAMRRWISDFHMDAVRFDATRALKDFHVIDWFNEQAHARSGFKPFFTAAEHIPQDTAITGPDGPVDAAWHDNFCRQMVATVLGIELDGATPFNTTELLRVLDARGDGFVSNYNTVTYMSNHDKERVAYLLGDKAGVYDDAAFNRLRLGASLLFTSPGIPMIWQGEEFGEASPRGEHSERVPITWSLLNNERNRALFDHYKSLIALRKSTGALTSDNFEVLANMVDRGIIAYKRWDDEGSIVIVVANLRAEPAGDFEVVSEGVDGGHWHEVTNGYDLEVDAHHLKDSLGGSEVKIYIKQG